MEQKKGVGLLFLTSDHISENIITSRNACVFGVYLALLFSSCSTAGKPCTQAGDLSGLPEIKGNMQCLQKRLADGKYVNDGKFLIWHPNGQVAIEGYFQEGKKAETWYFYDETGKKLSQKDFTPAP